MAVSLLGLDYEDFMTRLQENYRTTAVMWPGADFTPPTPAGAASVPADWIVPEILRSESFAYNVENAQGRRNSFVVYVATQPRRGDIVGRIDAIIADLADALGLDRNVSENSMDDTYSWTRASPPAIGDLSDDWDWYAITYRGDFYQQQVA